MTELVINMPNDKQKLFLDADSKYIGFGGARGGGKSWSVRTKAILLCLGYPGIKVMIIRRTYPELYENHIHPLCEQLHAHDRNKRNRLATYNDSKKHLVFPNRSRILFRYCENEKDAARFQGTEVDVMFVDEATHQSEESIRKLNACVRGVNKFPKRTYYTCNPGGLGHAWVKRLFIDKRYKDLEDPEDYMFVQSLVQDNTVLMHSDPDYIKQLESLPPKLREAWLYGKWDVFEGQAFEEFTDDPKHYEDRIGTHVINPFIIPDTWKIYRSFDWGYSKPFSVGWYAIDHENRMYRFRRYYGCQLDNRTKEAVPNTGVKMPTAEIAKNIKQIEDNDINLKGRTIFGTADPAIFDASTGVSIAEEMEKYKIYFEKADNTRIAGKLQVHYRFHFDEEGIPMFYVFKNDTDFIRTIPLLMYDDHKVEDVDTDGEDHCLIGSTLVHTSKGKKKIKNLVGTTGYVMSSDNQYHRYSDCRMTQENVQVSTVVLKDGSTVTATPNHRFMLADGTWKKLSELKPGDDVKEIENETYTNK